MGSKNIISGITHATLDSTRWWSATRALAGYIKGKDSNNNDVVWNYVTKITLKIPGELAGCVATNILVKVPLSGDSRVSGTVGRLSSESSTPGKCKSSTAIQTCTAQRLVDGSLVAYPPGWSSNYSNPDVYFSFDLNNVTLRTDDVYYVYLYAPTASDATYKLHGSQSGLSVYSATVTYLDTYTITYNANGGSGAPAAQTKIQGSNLKLSTTVPTRTGYTFQGWGTTSTTTTVSYASGATYSTDKDITLYAVWKVDTYKITYNANGGSGAPSSQTKTHGSSITLSSTEPTRAGCTFKGWATTSTATSATYQPGDTFTTNANTTLYAVWKILTYTVSYNANGGSGAPSSQIKTHGEDLILSSTTPTRTGHTFQGWTTSATSTTVEYRAGGTYTRNATITLFACWKANTYSIKYSANGYTVTGLPPTQTKTYGVSLPLSTATPDIRSTTSAGWRVYLDANGGECQHEYVQSTKCDTYEFSHWNTAANNTGANYAPGDSYSANSAATLYLQCTKTTEYLSVTLPAATRSGYEFAGWATSPDASIAVYTETCSPTADITLYAVWKSTSNGVVYIDTGVEWLPCTIWIDDGISWKQYIAYIDDGTQWKMLG